MELPSPRTDEEADQQCRLLDLVDHIVAILGGPRAK